MKKRTTSILSFAMLLMIPLVFIFLLFRQTRYNNVDHAEPDDPFYVLGIDSDGRFHAVHTSQFEKYSPLKVGDAPESHDLIPPLRYSLTNEETRKASRGAADVNFFGSGEGVITDMTREEGEPWGVIYEVKTMMDGRPAWTYYTIEITSDLPDIVNMVKMESSVELDSSDVATAGIGAFCFAMVGLAVIAMLSILTESRQLIVNKWTLRRE